MFVLEDFIKPVKKQKTEKALYTSLKGNPN